MDTGQRAAGFAVVWLLLTGFDAAALAAGALASAASTALSVYLVPPPQPRVPVGASVRFLGLLLRGMVTAGYDVARRAVLPARRMADPGYLRHRVAGANEMALMARSYALSLTPGTVASRIEEDSLEMHALDQRQQARDRHRIDGPAGEIGRHIAERKAEWRR